MALLDNGKTDYRAYDYDSAIRERYGALQSLGDSATQFSVEAAQRRLAARQAAEQAAWANAQNQANATGQQNSGNIQNMPYTGGKGGAVNMPYKGGKGFSSFMGAISSQESGNNYGARNSMSGAGGKYQIMPFNIEGSGGWDKEILGYNISFAQFMASPEIQEKIAQGKLQQYYDSYGPAGAAIAWYAGPGAAQKYVNTGYSSSRGEAGGHPSVSGYMASILRKMGLA